MNLLRRVTPLRYPGGKAQFAPFIQQFCEVNKLTNGHYAEPYAGGAGVAIGLLLSGSMDEIHINDIDLAVYSFWSAILEETDNFVQKIHDTAVTIDEWHRQKEVLANLEQYSKLERGFATFFLNRTNRSGILKGGVIGGKAQNGNYKLDVRFNKVDLIRRIENIAKFSDKIHVTNMDAVEFLQAVDATLPSNSLIYLDPPYYVKGQGLYRNFYEHDDHVKIREVVDSLKTPWLVSYDSCDEIKEIYLGHETLEYSLWYSAQVKGKGAEVMFYKKPLVLPDL